MNAPLLTAFFVCAALAFLSSGMEAGVFALTRWRISEQMRKGLRRAKVLHGFLENSENFLWTILVGNTLATFTVVSIIVFALHGKLRGHPFWLILSFFASVFAFYCFCDLLPKMLFQHFPNRLCLALAIPFRLIHVALSPIVALIGRLSRFLLRWTGGRVFTGTVFGSRNELRLAMQDSSQNLTTEERAMINRVLDLQHLTVRQVAIPFGKFPNVVSSMPVRAILELARTTPGNFFPVWHEEKNQRRIVGVVNLKKFLYEEGLKPEEPIRNYLASALYLREDLPLEQALRRMRRTGQRIAIILDLSRREMGVVTLDEILKVIFGEVRS